MTIDHYTITTGDLRRSPRSEVSAESIEFCRTLLARCPSPGGLECRAVAQAVAPLRRENEVLRSHSDHLSSEKGWRSG